VFPYIFPLITTYWSQATVMVKYMGEKMGGMDKLKGKKIALVYHDSAYGKEPIPVLTDMAKQYGYEFTPIAVPHPGNEQQSQWLQVRQLRPDWVILWGWGVNEPHCAQGRRQGRLSAREDHRRVVVRRGGRRDPGGRCRQGLRRRRASTCPAPASR
jgi:hypothetical protein